MSRDTLSQVLVQVPGRLHGDLFLALVLLQDRLRRGRDGTDGGAVAASAGEIGLLERKVG